MVLFGDRLTCGHDSIPRLRAVIRIWGDRPVMCSPMAGVGPPTPDE